MPGKHGHEMSSAERDDLLRGHLDERLVALGFERVRARAWVRCRIPHVRDLFEIQIWKGQTRSPAWGWSLDFVPHVVGRRGIRWHRTSKSARLDLRYDPLDYPERGGPVGWDVPVGWGVPVADTHRCAEVVATRALAEAPSFWDGVILRLDSSHDIRSAFADA